MDKLLKIALKNAGLTTGYIMGVVLFISSLQVFSKKEDMMIIPIAMLLLFVTSAAITGFLVFGKPVMLYIDGRKEEAVSLLANMIGILFIITLVFFLALIGYYTLIP